MSDERLLPAGSCDCHLHVFDRRFAALPDALYREATVEDYRRLCERLGIDRAVIVQPSGYGFDNRATLDALDRLGPGARAVVVVPATTDADDYRRLHALGVRGVRFMLLRPGGLGWDDLLPVAETAGAAGLHLNLQFDGHEMPRRLPGLRQLSCDLVIDHVGAFVGGTRTDAPAFRALASLLDGGRAWIKLSGPYTYRMSAVGPPGYPEVAELVRWLVRAYPERCLWATDWPHVSEAAMLDDESLATAFLDWAGDAATLKTITVDNPARLYGFAAGDTLDRTERAS